MPDPTLRPEARLDQLRAYVDHVRSNNKAKNDVIYAKANYQGDDGRLIRSVIDSVGGKEREERALAMLFQALENSYGPNVAAHVFTHMPENLLNNGAALSTRLIDNAKKAAEKRQSELADLAKINENKINENENKIDIDLGDDDDDDDDDDLFKSFSGNDLNEPLDEDNLLGSLNEDDPFVSFDSNDNIVVVDSNKNDSVINLKPNSSTIDLKPNTVTGPKKKGGWFSWFSKKPKKNAASGKSNLSDLDKTQMKLADTKNKIKKIKKTYRRLDDDRKTLVKNKKEQKKKLLQKNLERQKKIKKPKKISKQVKTDNNEGDPPTRRKGKDDKHIEARRKQLVEQADNIKKMQYTLYIKYMEKGSKGVLKFNDLIKAASLDDNPRKLNSKEKKRVMSVIYGAFLNSDGEELTRQSPKLITENIVLPVVRRYLPQLGMR